MLILNGKYDITTKPIYSSNGKPLKVRVPEGQDSIGLIYPAIREAAEAINEHDARIASIETAIASLEKAIAHFSKGVK